MYVNESSKKIINLQLLVLSFFSSIFPKTFLSFVILFFCVLSVSGGPSWFFVQSMALLPPFPPLAEKVLESR